MRLVFIFLAALFISFSVQAKTISVVSLEWPPFCGANEGKKIQHDIIDKAFGKVGYNVDWQVLPWSRALHYAKEGRVQGIACLWYNEERAQWIQFSDPNRIANEMVVFKRKGESILFDGDFTKLRGYRIGAVTGFAYPEGFTTSGLKLDYVKNDVINLKKLVAKRIDLFINDKIQTLHLIKENIPDKAPLIDFIDYSVKMNKLYMGFSKKAPNYKDLNSKFNEGLKAIEASGELDAIKKSYGLN